VNPRLRSRVALTLAVTACVALWFGLLAGCGTGGSRVESGAGQGGPARAGNARGFRSRERLEEHYAKHGREFGDISIGEYLALAQRLRDAPPGGDVLELRRPAGRARFDRASGAFGAYDEDGTIRTFFKPRDGEAYFRRQARRHGD
jgi:hypothetical protein